MTKTISNETITESYLTPDGPDQRPSGVYTSAHLLDSTVLKDRANQQMLRHVQSLYISRNISIIKIIKCGKYIEIYVYQDPVKLGISSRSLSRTDLLRIQCDKKTAKKNRSVEYRSRSSIIARNHIRRLVQCNFTNNSKFITLTFTNDCGIDINSIRECNSEFKKFIQRMRRKFNNFKYICVIEFQKRGAVHYHIISDLPYIANNVLSEIWGNGFTFIQDISAIGNVGTYVTKYMTKNLFDDRLIDEKIYFSSKNLIKPEKMYSIDAKKVIEYYDLIGKNPEFVNMYISKMNGKVIYLQYNLDMCKTN